MQVNEVSTGWEGDTPGVNVAFCLGSENNISRILFSTSSLQ